MPKCIFVIFILCLLACSNGSSDNETPDSSDDSTSTGNYLYVPSDYATIQAAIDAAADGDTVWLADGIYASDTSDGISFKGKASSADSERRPRHGCS